MHKNCPWNTANVAQWVLKNNTRWWLPNSEQPMSSITVASKSWGIQKHLSWQISNHSTNRQKVDSPKMIWLGHNIFRGRCPNARYFFESIKRRISLQIVGFCRSDSIILESQKIGLWKSSYTPDFSFTILMQNS